MRSLSLLFLCLQNTLMHAQTLTAASRSLRVSSENPWKCLSRRPAHFIPSTCSRVSPGPFLSLFWIIQVQPEKKKVLIK